MDILPTILAQLRGMLVGNSSEWTEDDVFDNLRLLNPPEINLADDEGYTILQLACLCRLQRVVAMALRLGADPAVRNKGGCTALHLASFKGKAEIVEMLLKHAQHQTTQGVNAVGQTAHQTGHTEPGSRLISLVNAADNTGSTPLHEAAHSGPHDVVQLLLDAGANVDPQNKDGRTPIYGALERCQRFPMHFQVVESLLAHGASLSTVDKGHVTPLGAAIQAQAADAVQRLLDRGARLSSKESGAAIVQTQTWSMKHLMRSVVGVADLNSTYNNRPILLEVVWRNEWDCAAELVGRGADVSVLRNRAAMPAYVHPENIMRLKRIANRRIFSKILLFGACARRSMLAHEQPLIHDLPAHNVMLLLAKASLARPPQP